MLLQLFLREERVPVDTLHRRITLAALPVGGRGLGLELEGLDLPRGFEMRAEAEIDEVAHRVALHGVVGLLADQLDLEVLTALREQVQRLGLRDQLPLDAAVLLDDVGHLLLDGRQILRRERLRHQEVVEETVVGGRSDAVLRVGEQLRHRRREQVGGGVPVDLDGRIGRLGLA
jgi:hypothetical protein